MQKSSSTWKQLFQTLNMEQTHDFHSNNRLTERVNVTTTSVKGTRQQLPCYHGYHGDDPTWSHLACTGSGTTTASRLPQTFSLKWLKFIFSARIRSSPQSKSRDGPVLMDTNMGVTIYSSEQNVCSCGEGWGPPQKSEETSHLWSLRKSALFPVLKIKCSPKSWKDKTKFWKKHISAEIELKCSKGSNFKYVRWTRFCQIGESECWLFFKKKQNLPVVQIYFLWCSKLIWTCAQFCTLHLRQPANPSKDATLQLSEAFK